MPREARPLDPSPRTMLMEAEMRRIKGNVCFFALNLEGPNFAAIRERRIELTERILAALGYLPR
jgi:hypothetical protein